MKFSNIYFQIFLVIKLLEPINKLSIDDVWNDADQIICTINKQNKSKGLASPGCMKGKQTTPIIIPSDLNLKECSSEAEKCFNLSHLDCIDTIRANFKGL